MVARKAGWGVWARLVAALTTFVLTGCSVEQRSERVDFRGARLGMSLAEWKAAPPPKQTIEFRRSSCSTERPQRLWVDVRLKPERATAGVVACIYMTDDVPANQTAGNSEVDVTYCFFGSKLYEMDISVLDGALPAIRADLLKRFGSPASSTSSTTAMRSGEILPTVEEIWRVGRTIILLQAPNESFDLARLRFIDLPMQRSVDEAVKAVKPPSTGWAQDALFPAESCAAK